MLHRENQELSPNSGPVGHRPTLVINNLLKAVFEEDNAGMHNLSFVSFCHIFSPLNFSAILQAAIFCLSSVKFK